jgi:protein-disulfide isomerase
MQTFLRIALAALAAELALAPAAAQTGAAERQQIEQIIREYLVANPEVIEEAVNALRQKREAEAVAAQSRAIEERRMAIFDSPHQAVLGNPEGPITLVEFFDYNCGYCKRALSDLTALIEANPDLRVVMKEFPILSQGSIDAARISIAVKEVAPERYLQFHQELFTRPGEATAEKALEIARDLGLDAAGLQAAADKESVARNLQEVEELAMALGISGTPSYIIGTELVPGAAGFDVLNQKVAAMRQCGETTC